MSPEPANDNHVPLRVMVCEDEGLTALRLRRTLESLGHEVVAEARDGEEAVLLALERRPDVILMDIRMPKLDGVAATTRIMTDAPTAIVMVSAYSDQELVDAAVEAGASNYLVKPVSDDQLAPAVILAHHRFQQFKELGNEVEDLKEALEVRKLVERAKGILMDRLQLSEADAFRRLQSASRDRRQSLGETARQLIDAAELLR